MESASIALGHDHAEEHHGPPEANQSARIDRTILGRTVHLSPGYRYTLDSEDGEPIWFAYFGATHTSAVDPDVAARKALGLHGPPA